MYGRTTWYYKVDPELKLIHAFYNCRALKIPIKYGYAQEITVQNEDDAERLDRLVEEGYKICHTCWKREQGLATKDRRRVRPGFRREPPL